MLFHILSNGQLNYFFAHILYIREYLFEYTTVGVIFIPSDNKQPVRYLITLHKTCNVKKLKTKLLELIGEESVDIVMAEVFDEHISRILVRYFFHLCT